MGSGVLTDCPERSLTVTTGDADLDDVSTVEPAAPGAETSGQSSSNGSGKTGSRKGLLVNTFWSLAAEGLRLVSSVITFLLLTRIHGPEQFGIFGAGREPEGRSRG